MSSFLVALWITGMVLGIYSLACGYMDEGEDND